MMAWLRVFPRVTTSPEVVNPGAIFAALLSRNQDILRELPGAHLEYAWHEYGAYLGPIALGLAALGLVTQWRRAWPFALIGAMGLCFAIGNFPGDWSLLRGLSPWALLRRIPPFSSQHVAARFLFEVAFSLSILAGFGVTALERVRRFGPRFGTVVPPFLLALSTLDCWLVGPPNLEHAFDVGPAQLEHRELFTHARQPGPGWGTTWMYSLELANIGTVNCYDPVGPHSEALPADAPGFRGEQYLEGPGEVRLEEWSPNALRFEVDAPAPVKLVVNANNDGGWRLTAGEGGILPAARLEVQLPAGRQSVRLQYRKGSAVLGASISGLAAAVLLALGWMTSRRAS